MEQKTVGGQVYNGFSIIIKLLIAATVGLGLLLLLRIIFLFFGAMKTFPGYRQVIDWTQVFVEPLARVGEVKTPYDGAFDIGATILLVLVLVSEFIMSSIQGFVERRARLASQAKLAPAEDEPELTDATPPPQVPVQ